ncbi:MAG TPA: hypothetical protein VFX59_03175 [Polyangiales bacterium]|nr:hypothetical protein [Polyangiales bacterium]
MCFGAIRACSINPNSGDTGGLLQDRSTVNQGKLTMLEALMCAE